MRADKFFLIIHLETLIFVFQKATKGVMVGIVQKSPVTSTLPNSPLMPATNFPTMHQIPSTAGAHAAVVTPTAVPLTNQNGSIGLPVGQIPPNGMVFSFHLLFEQEDGRHLFRLVRTKCM